MSAVAEYATALIVIAGIGHAQPGDFSACTSVQYDRVRTDGEIAATISACTRVIAEPTSAAEQRAHAFYFRGLNHFLAAVNRAIADGTTIVSGGDTVQTRLSLALADLAACIESTPAPHPLPHSLRATIYTSLNQYDRALPDLDQAIRADPDNSVARVQRALIWERMDRFAEARDDLDVAISLDARNQNALINRAQLWTRYGDIEQAYADFARAEAVGGSQTWFALSGRGKLAVRLGEPLKAFADWTRAAELAPLPNLAAQFHVRAGNLARDYLKEPERAAQAYDRALAALPDYADALIQRGIGYERMNRFDDAARAYRKAIDVTRGNPIDKGFHDQASFRLEVLKARSSRKATEGALSMDINVLSRSAGAGVRKRVALVVGNAAYTHVAPLMNADRDAESVGGALSEAGFSRVTVATNLNRGQIDSLLLKFAEEAAGADWAVVYYAGHGVEIDGRNFVIPIDADPETLKRPTSGAISLEELLGAAGPARQLRLIALDACRDNPFVQESHRLAAREAGRTGARPSARAVQPKSIGGGFARLQIEQANTVVLYSTQPGQVALDGDELNSPFTRAFLKNLPVRGLDLQSFFRRIGDDVAAMTDQRQRPAVNGRLGVGEKLSFFPN
jgi:tetratricopeptide (TPR) repeat protein